MKKISKEEKDQKAKNKDEVLLCAICSGGASPKKRVTFFPLNSRGAACWGLKMSYFHPPFPSIFFTFHCPINLS
jgi:hypothetical protein